MDPAWEPALHESLPEQVAKTILGRIAAGELEPGDRLPPQRELARAMDVGLSVVREAIQRLEVLKVLATRHGKGTIVQPVRWMQLVYDPVLFAVGIDRIEAAAFWEARHALEREVLRLATLRARPEDVAVLAKILAEADPAPTDHDVHMALNRAFHLAIVRAARNRVLEDMLAPLLSIRLPTAAARFDRTRSQATWDAHRLIHDAIVARDLGAAMHALVVHARVGSVVLEDMARSASDDLCLSSEASGSKEI